MQEIARLGKSYDVRFHPDGGRLVAIRGSTELVLAQVPGAEVVSSFRFRDGAAVAVARDGSRIAVVNTSGGGVILDGESFEERVRTSGRGIGEGPGVVFGPDATRYVQASWNGDMLVRESASGEVVYRERHQGEAIHALASTRDGTLFGYAASRNGDEDHAVLLRRWPFETNRPETLVEFNGPGRGADAIALGENGMVALLVDRSVRTYSGDGGDCLVERPWAFLALTTHLLGHRTAPS